MARLFLKIERDHGDVENLQTLEGDLVNVTQLESNYDKLSPTMQEDMGLFLNQFQEHVQNSSLKLFKTLGSSFLEYQKSEDQFARPSSHGRNKRFFEIDREMHKLVRHFSLFSDSDLCSEIYMNSGEKLVKF